jgi:hypothetical protein
MSIDANDLHALPPAEKLRIVELLWDDLGESAAPIPLPDWVDREAARRRDEMRDPKIGMTHEETWRRITTRNGQEAALPSTLRVRRSRGCSLVRSSVGRIGRCICRLGPSVYDGRYCRPERFAVSPCGCRYIRIPRFPYVVLFDLVREELLMLGVLHTARSMDKWRERHGGV